MANRGRSHPPGNRGPAPGRTIQAQRDFSIVGVGASAGGLDAFAGLLRALPSRPGVAIVLVQHLDPSRDSALAAIVARITALPVRVATEGLLVAPNHVYVIPPNTVMEIRRGRLRLVPRVRGPALPVDAFLRSLAADLGSRAIGVILSGSASDGVRGLEAIRAEGGITFAQTEASAGFTGMPHSAVASGCVDFILPPAEIARELARLGRTPYVEPDAAAPAARGGDDPAALGRIHSLLLANSGVDFSLYKPSTILRRIGRRMSLHRHATLQVYAEYLTRTATEQEALFRDLLIPVTAFFRDPAAFRTLENRVFSRMLRHRADEEPVRIWVPGCSTGEEAYSVAISLAETMARLRRTSPMLVLATDLSERSLEQARTAVYPETITQEVPADLLRRHFTRLPHGYEISGAIRKACVFARHNLAADTPYSRLDLIVCRNVLIYMEPALQKRIFGVLHYALRPGGFLMLGSSESAAAHPALFRPADRRQRIYIRRDAGPDVPLRPAAATPPLPVLPVARPGPLALGSEANAVREANRVLAHRYAPAGVVVNGDLEILQFRGDTSAYLHPTPGRASLNLLRMVRHSLLPDLRRAIHQARRTQAAVRREGAWLRNGKAARRVAVEVVPLRSQAMRDVQFFVAFQDAPPTAVAGPRGKGGGAAPLQNGALATRLRQELTATKEYLQGVIEQHEATAEELRSAHEEVLSSNEELQSTNEELQTAQEEMQSTNEELTTLNGEAQQRNRELARVTHDLASLLSSIELPIVLLDDLLAIRRFTPAAATSLGLTPADLGRPILNLNLNLVLPREHPGLEALLREAVELRRDHELEVQNREGHWFKLRLQQYLAAEQGPAGLVLSLFNIDAEREAVELERARATATEDELLKREANLHMVFDQVPAVVWTTDLTLKVTSCLGSVPEAVDRRTREGGLPALAGLFGGGGDASPWALAHRRALAGELATFEYRHGERVYSARVGPKIRHSTGKLAGTIGAAHDITEYKRLDQAKNDFISTVSHELRTPVTSIHGALRLLATRLSPEVPVDARTLVDLASRNSEVLARLVGDIVDLQKIESGRLVLTTAPVDLADLAHQAMELNRPYGQHYGVSYVLAAAPEGLIVDGDADRLRQVAANLLSNAAKFSPQGAKVRISVEPRDDKARMSVLNFGPPISELHRERIFEKFGTVDSSDSRLRGGTGLGLSISRSIIQQHGGTLDYTSDPERGTEFYFELPLTEHSPFKSA